MEEKFMNGAQATNLLAEEVPVTENLELPLMQPEERANYLDKWNTAMGKIDSSVGLLQADSGSQGTDVEALKETTAETKKELSELQEMFANHIGSYNDLASDVSDAEERLETVELRSQTTETVLENHLGSYSAFKDETEQDISSLTSSVNTLSTDVENALELIDPESIEEIKTTVSSHWGTQSSVLSRNNPTNFGLANVVGPSMRQRTISVDISTSDTYKSINIEPYVHSNDGLSQTTGYLCFISISRNYDMPITGIMIKPVNYTGSVRVLWSPMATNTPDVSVTDSHIVLSSLDLVTELDITLIPFDLV